MKDSLSRRRLLQAGAGLMAAGLVRPLVSAGAAESRSASYLPSLYDRAKLASRCLVEHCDKKRGYVPYFYTRMSGQPPLKSLWTWSYGDGQGRSVDALALLRHMTGENIESRPDRAMRASLLGMIGPDGCVWCPAEPWTEPLPHMMPHWPAQGTMLAFTTLYQLTGDARYRQTVEKQIEGLSKSLVRQPEGQLSFPGDSCVALYGWRNLVRDPMHPYTIIHSVTTMPALRYFRLTGHEPALQYASDLMALTLAKDGGKTLFNQGHFHCRSRFVTSLMLRGAIKNDKNDFELAEMLYKKARTLGTQSGWFPEQINNPDGNRSNLSETCCLTDMLESAILLARHHNPVYWNDVERYIRNHLLVHQIVDLDWIPKMAAFPLNQHALGYLGDGKQATGGTVSGDAALQTLIGAFAGWGGITAMSDDTSFSNSNQHCCNAAGGRALYDAWCYAVSDKDGVFQVNLHTHRNHTAAEIVAEEAIRPRPSLPAGGTDEVGGLQIKIKANRRLKVRIPDFVTAKEMQVNINGNSVPAHGDGVYLDIAAARSGDHVEVLYPLKSRTTEEKLAAGAFTFKWRGATVVEASPVQKIRPLFNPERFTSTPPSIGPVIKTEMESL